MVERQAKLFINGEIGKENECKSCKSKLIGIKKSAFIRTS